MSKQHYFDQTPNARALLIKKMKSKRNKGMSNSEIGQAMGCDSKKVYRLIGASISAPTYEQAKIRKGQKVTVVGGPPEGRGLYGRVEAVSNARENVKPYLLVGGEWVLECWSEVVK